MGKLSELRNRPGPGIAKDAPEKTGARLFLDILWREFWELLKLNLLFLLFCVPVVTIPAALTGMTRVTLSMVQDKNHFLWADFVAVFRREFWRSLACGLLLALGLGATVFGVLFYAAVVPMQALRFALCALGIAAFLIIWGMGQYVLVQLALLDLRVRDIFRNAFALLFVCIRRSVSGMLGTLALLVLGIGLLPYSMPVVVMALFALTSLVAVFQAYPAVAEYLIVQPQPDPAAAPTDWRSERKRVRG